MEAMSGLLLSNPKNFSGMMLSLNESFEFISDLQQHKKTFDGVVSYGTAGFRANADTTPLDFVMFRVGCIVGLRSRFLGGSVCGAVVTASHNSGEDNGVKIVEPDGSMLHASWEGIADEAVNASSTAELRKALEKIPITDRIAPSGLVFIGFDTRGSSERLVRCLVRGCQAVNATVENYGLLTTPVLHHLVRHANGFGHSVTMASIEGYARMLKEGLEETLGGATACTTRGRLIVDAAGGVGSVVLSKIMEDCSNKLGSVICAKLGISEIVVANKANDALVELNEKCGAEFVQKKRQPPSLSGLSNPVGNDRIASLDGDADRLVYSYTDVEKGWRLLDGDKIATLFALFINTELKKANIKDAISVGLVQTAYANGASTNYVKNVMPESFITITIAKTGVKFVEHEAKTFDIGMYFEANGHGTVIFSPKAVGVLEAARPTTNKILGFYKLINQAVGDAISDFLGVEAILTSLNMSVQQWDQLYEDLPSRQGKISVSDRTLIKCTDDETRIISPASLQTEIDNLVAGAGPQARAFVRPSGTEDAARVYAEALTKDLANSLAYQVAKAAWRAVGKPGSAEPKESDYV